RLHAQDPLASAQETYTCHYNKGKRNVSFQVGDKVLVNPHSLELVDVKGTRRKLVQRMIGLFIVQERINLLVYRLFILDTYPMHPVITI
ncbi:hypothetical protein CERSUDRAFT_40861, partial [Gelatoporia subvermispora B]